MRVPVESLLVDALPSRLERREFSSLGNRPGHSLSERCLLSATAPPGDAFSSSSLTSFSSFSEETFPLPMSVLLPLPHIPDSRLSETSCLSVRFFWSLLPVAMREEEEERPSALSSPFPLPFPRYRLALCIMRQALIAHTLICFLLALESS